MAALDIKICGLKTAAAIERCSVRGATHLGFVHFARSPRHLTLGEMAALRPLVRPPVRLAVVTVDADDETLRAIAASVRPDLLQLHGGESPERVAAVKRLTGLPVIKAISVGSAADLGAVSGYRNVADRIMLDARRPKGSELPGGNGVSFDWNLLAALDPAVPYILSGGLHPGNVAEAVSRLAPAGIDASSGVESAPGVKDLKRIDRFFAALPRVPAFNERIPS